MEQAPQPMKSRAFFQETSPHSKLSMVVALAMILAGGRLHQERTEGCITTISTPKIKWCWSRSQKQPVCIANTSIQGMSDQPTSLGKQARHGIFGGCCSSSYPTTSSVATQNPAVARAHHAIQETSTQHTWRGVLNNRAASLIPFKSGSG